MATLREVEKKALKEWKEWTDTIRGVASKVIDTWWWSEEIQDCVKRKKLAKKEWDRKSDEQSKREYKEICKETKRRVTKSKNEVYEKLYQKLNTKEGEKRSIQNYKTERQGK